MTQTIEQLIARWDADEGKPYKGALIDPYALIDKGGELPLSCMCAQGQVLHVVGGWSAKTLRDAAQNDADREVARLLGISLAHSVLLRRVNDKADGAPSVVLTTPEKVLGPNAAQVLAFWRYLDAMKPSRWRAAGAAYVAAAAAAYAAAAYAADADAADAADADADAGAAAAADADAAAAAAAAYAADDYADAADADAAADAARSTTYELIGAVELRAKGRKFFFLPMFGFNTPEDIPV